MKVATLAIQGSFSTPKLFSNMSDDDGHISPLICLMAKGEKVKLNPNPLQSLVIYQVVNLVKALVMMILVTMMSSFK